MNARLGLPLAALLSCSAVGCDRAPEAAPTPVAATKGEPIPSAPAPLPAEAAPQPEQGAAGSCTFDPPQFFGSLPAKWEGGCQDGRAHGRGVLRSYDGKQVGAIFFGAMERGNPQLGVVEDRDGLIIGRFAPGGKPIANDDFKDRLDGVNEAVAAAKQISDFYSRSGNAASAAFYAKKVKMLDQQIE